MIPPCPANPPSVTDVKMLIDAKIAEERRIQFYKTRIGYLSSVIRKPENQDMNYSVVQLADLLDKIDQIIPIDDPVLTGLRVYFANCKWIAGDNDNNDLFPNEYNNMLTLIFSPTVQKGGITATDSGYFFYMDHTGQIGNVTDITNATGAQNLVHAEWIRSFVDMKNKVLSQYIGKKDTISCWYPKQDLLDLVCYLKSKNVPGIRVSYGSYADVEKQIYFEGSYYDVSKQTTLCIHINEPEPALVEDSFFKQSGSLPFFRAYLPDEDADTTIPCPPASCGGSLYP